MRTLILTILLLSVSTSFAKTLGGATSGGGDLEGIEATKILSQVFDSIIKINDKLYSVEELNIIEKIKYEVNLIMVDSELATNTKNLIQNGAAFSIRENNKATVFIKRNIWNNISSFQAKEVLIHHEIMILAGIEETGDYHYSLKYQNIKENDKTLSLDKNIFCIVNIFKKAQLYGKQIPGELVGSSSALMTFSGMKGDWGILKTVSDKAIVWRGLIDSSGFFKMEIGEVGYNSADKYRYSKGFLVDFRTFKVIEDMRVYVDTDQEVNPVQNPIVFTDKHVISVNCNKID